MGGMLLALTNGDEDKLLALKSDAQRLSLVQTLEKGYGQLKGGYAFDTDTAWDAIHRCFDGGQLSLDTDDTLQMAILGGTSLHEGEDYVISYKTQQDVADIHAALARVTAESMGASYNEIDPKDYGLPLSKQDWDYTWSYFEEVRSFYERAAKAERAVIFTVDQ